MPHVLFIRHGRTTANADGVLAGWSSGVHLDDHGLAQARHLGASLSTVRLAAVVSSPLERTVETAEHIVTDQRRSPDLHLDERFGECRYGEWTGRKLRDLSKEPLWRTVQGHPSAVRFPGEDGESLAQMQARAVTALRDWNARLGDRSVYAVVSHGDVIKALLADALGMHLDHFQRIQVDPCSVSVVAYTAKRPFVLRMNAGAEDAVTSLAGVRRRRGSDATVGGGSG